ncbi:RDD family protein [Bacteroidia bacterium]|nr:RDD family protein [Bacteroidia bacterium]
MESVGILTGQNVIIKYQTATVVERMCALLLDYLINFASLFTILFAFFKVFEDWGMLSDGVEYTLFAVFGILAMSYHFLFESILGGKTPGKMIMKIKVTNLDGSTPGIGAYFLRWLLMTVDVLLLSGSIGALFIIFSTYHQRLGDLAAGTIVVKTNPPTLLDLDESYYAFSDDYEPTFINVERLTEGQITFITNLLIDPKNKPAVENSIDELAAKVKKILDVEPKIKNRLFLETVLRDYNYYAALGI